MSKIKLNTGEVNDYNDNEFYSELYRADDWSNFDELYRAANTLHIMKYLLSNAVTVLPKKSAEVISTITSQLNSAGYSLIYNTSDELIQIIPPAGANVYPTNYDPFVVTSNQDIINEADNETAVTLREALFCDPNYRFNEALINSTMTITLTSPLVIDKNTIIEAPLGKHGTIKGDISITTSKLSITSIILNGNTTIASGCTLKVNGRSGDSISGSVTGGTLILSGTIKLNANIHGLENLNLENPNITLGTKSDIDLTGTLVTTKRSNPMFNRSYKKWSDEQLLFNKQGIDFSNIAGIMNLDSQTDNIIYHIGDIGIFSQTIGLDYGYFDGPKKCVYEVMEDSSKVYFGKLTNIQIDKASATGNGSVTFEDAVDSGFSILSFNDALTNVPLTYYDGIRAYASCSIDGKGMDSTSISGGKFFASANAIDMKDLTFTGTLFGGRNTVTHVRPSGTSYTDTGSATDDSNLSLNNVRVMEGSRIYGGGAASLAQTTLTQREISVTLTDTFVGNGVSIYGAGLVTANNGALQTTGVTLDIDSSNADGCSGNIYAGGYFAKTNGDISINGSVNTIVRNGHFNFTGNGTRTTEGNSAEQGESTLRVENGTFEGPVYAGGYSMGGEAVVNGSTNLEITGGVFQKEIYGGFGADKAKNGSFTVIDGSTNIHVTADDTTIHFNGCIFAGSYGAGSILGKDGLGTSLTFTGDGDVIQWGASSRIYGCCQLTRASITGSRELVFDAFSNSKAFGTLDAKNGFDTVRVLNGSNVSFNRHALLSNIHNWNLEAGASLTWNTRKTPDANDLDGDSLDIIGLDTEMEDSTLLSGCTILNWTNASVTFNGGQSCACTNGIYTDGTYKLWLDGNAVKVGLLASA